MKRRNKGAFLGGIGVGVLNGLLGAGGGLITVPLLDLLGVRGKQSHATSLAIIVPLSLLSAGIYWFRGWAAPGDALPYLPGGLVGAAAGAWLLCRLNTGWVKVLFGLLLLWAGVRQAFL